MGINTEHESERKERDVAHIFVGIVERNRDILLVQRTEENVPSAHGKWELPGGKVQFGETPAAAVEREFLEETGFHVKALKLLPSPFVHLWHYQEKLQHTVLLCFLCELQRHDQVRKVKDPEVRQTKWISIPRMKTLPLMPGSLHFLSQLEELPAAESKK